MGKGKRPLWLTILALAAVLYLINPVAIIPSIIKLRLKGAVLAVIFTLALVSVVIYFAFKKKTPTDTEIEKEYIKQYSSKHRQQLVQIRSLGMDIDAASISKKTEELCASIEKLLIMADNDIDKTVKVDSFIDDYLSTLTSVLAKFSKLEVNNALTEEVLHNAEGCLDKINQMAEKCISSINDMDVMDITAEMETLVAMCRRDGLLVDENVIQLQI